MIKTLYNIARLRLGMCNSLSNEYVDSIRINECNEPLHWYGTIKVRSGVANKLARVKQKIEAQGSGIEFVHGYLNLRWQQKLLGGTFEYETGGAVSVKLVGDDPAMEKILYKEMICKGFINYPKGSTQYHYGDKIWAAYKGKRRAMYGNAFKAQTKDCSEEIGSPEYEQYIAWLTNEKDRTKWEDEHPKPSPWNKFKEYYNPHCTECMENGLEECAKCTEFWEYYVDGDKIPDQIYDKL